VYTLKDFSGSFLEKIDFLRTNQHLYRKLKSQIFDYLGKHVFFIPLLLHRVSTRFDGQKKGATSGGFSGSFLEKIFICIQS
jgi:hypothetical protein